MTKEQYLEVENNLEMFEFTSLTYIEYEEIAAYEVVKINPKVIIIYGFNIESKYYEFHWACNTQKDLLQGLEKRNDNELLTFVPKDWVNDLELEGFHINAVWNDYFAMDLEKYANDSDQIFVTADKYIEASEVTRSCLGQSRGFMGQSKEWMKQWIENSKSAVPDYASHCVVLAEMNDEMLGVVCIGMYGEEDKRILWIREIAVRPEVSGRGIGRKLLGQAFAYGLLHKAKKAFLLADECNINAIHLYKSMGFKAKVETGQIDMIR